jgi:hypothetical protein
LLGDSSFDLVVQLNGPVFQAELHLQVPLQQRPPLQLFKKVHGFLPSERDHGKVQTVQRLRSIESTPQKDFIANEPLHPKRWTKPPQMSHCVVDL